MTEFEHACPRCGEGYKTDGDVELCQVGHKLFTSKVLGEHFRAVRKEVFICVYMLKRNAVLWTQRWSERMPEDRELWRKN